MAQLKDTLIQGSARVTDTLYTNKIQISQVLAPTASNGATFGVGADGQILKSNGTSVYWSSDVTGDWTGTTIPVSKGGTGATSFTANSVIMSGSTTTGAFTTRAIDDATANGALGTGTGLTTERSVYYGLVTVNNASQTRATGIYAPTTGGTANTQALVGNGATTAPKWVDITPSSAWTAGTTSGPVLKITVLGQTESTGSTIPSASISASGIVTTGGQAFKGRKVFGYMTRKGYDDSGNATRYIEDTYLQNNAGTAVGEHWYDVGDPTNITMGKFSWREYSPNSTANTATTGYHETYSLPAVTAGLTASASYSILTTKSAVTVAQGGTGKTSWTQWGVLYASTTTALTNTGAGTTAQFLTGAGSAAPAWGNTLKQTANAVLGINTSTFQIGTARKDLNFDIGNGSGTGVNDGYAGGITWGNGTSAYAGIYYQSSGSYGTRLIFATTGSYANGAYGRMIVQSDGKVGIGTMTPDTLLTVSGAAKVTGNLTVGDAISVGTFTIGDASGDASKTISSSSSFYLNSGSSASLIIGTNGGTKRLQIDADGNTKPYADDTYTLGTTAIRWKQGFFNGTGILVGAKNYDITSTSSSQALIKNISITLNTCKANDATYGYFLHAYGVQQARLFYGTRGTASTDIADSTVGQTILEIGNNIAAGVAGTPSGAENSQGCLRLFNKGVRYASIYAGYSVSNAVHYLPQYYTGTSSGTTTYYGRLVGIYKSTTSGQDGFSDKGSATQPVYVDSHGVVQTCTAYSSASVASATNATTAGKISNLTTSDAASSTTTARRVWFSYNDNVTGRPAYDDNFTYTTNGGTLKVNKIITTGTGLRITSSNDSYDILFRNDNTWGYCMINDVSDTANWYSYIPWKINFATGKFYIETGLVFTNGARRSWGTEAQRPSNPVTGEIYFQTD